MFYEPRSPQLVPVSSTDTDEVERDIRRGDGQPFLFRSGTAIAVPLRDGGTFGTVSQKWLFWL